LKIAERAEVCFSNGEKYLLYVIGLRDFHGEWDIVHSISERNGFASRGLKFCPLDGLVSYSEIRPS
jgi:hypothetical protein